MAPKVDTSKKNTKKKFSPKSDDYLINEETSESCGDVVEYSIKKKASHRETLPRGIKTPTKVVIDPKKKIRIKQSNTPHHTQHHLLRMMRIMNI